MYIRFAKSCLGANYKYTIKKSHPIIPEMQVYIKENNANVLDNMTQGTRMIYSKATDQGDG